MAYGTRTWAPFGFGAISGVFIGFLLFSFNDVNQQIIPHIQTDIQVFEHWLVQVNKLPVAPNNAQNSAGKVLLLSYLHIHLKDKYQHFKYSGSTCKICSNRIGHSR
jgi:hypothetical protein